MHRRILTVLGLAALVSTAGACGSSSDGGEGRMTVRLVDAPAAYQEVNLRIERVEIHGDEAGWVTLGTPARTVNLLALVDGVSELLADQTLPAGRYGQMRLVLGAGNTVRLPDGTLEDLKVPSGMQSGVKLNVHFEVAPGTTKDVFIDFDAHKSIFVHQAGNSGKYLLRPVVRAFDRVVTGSISGQLADAATDAGLPEVIVTAQTVDASGTPTVVRSARTRPDGSYTLDLLPVGGTYHVVSQPVVGATSFAARASPPLAISAAAPTAVWDAEFGATAQVGSIAGTITPAATEADGDLVSVRQLLDAGGVQRSLVVRDEPALVAGGSESYLVAGLPAGSASVLVTRQTVGPDGDETVRSSAPTSVVVPVGAAATADLVLP
jgi:hypothetical protein